MQGEELQSSQKEKEKVAAKLTWKDELIARKEQQIQEMKKQVSAAMTSGN